MIFRINDRSGVPPYLQMVHQVKQDIRLGLLKAGDQLPSVREVVTMIAINPNTVVKAYRELEALGLIEKRSGIGTFVSSLSNGPPPTVQAALLAKLSSWLEEARATGLDEETIEMIFNSALHNKTKEQP